LTFNELSSNISIEALKTPHGTLLLGWLTLALNNAYFDNNWLLYLRHTQKPPSPTSQATQALRMRVTLPYHILTLATLLKAEQCFENADF
jgi:hypothetical protein